MIRKHFWRPFSRGFRIFAVWVASSTTATSRLCISFHATLAVTMQCLLICIHLILMLRGLFVLQFSLDCHSEINYKYLSSRLVFALYNRKRWVGILLLSVLGAQNIAQAISSFYTVPAMQSNPVCHVVEIPRSAAIHGSVRRLSFTALLNFVILFHLVTASQQSARRSSSWDSQSSSMRQLCV
jgi:hypothetical protein